MPAKTKGTSVQLRDYRPEDFNHIWALDQRCFSREIAYSRAEFSYYLSSKTAICLIGSNENQILGFILGDRHRKTLGHIITLDVDASARRDGLGSMLMRALEERLTSEGCMSIFLEVAVDNRSALAFYKKHGYSVVKTLPRYYPGDLDGLLMGKKLGLRR